MAAGFAALRSTTTQILGGDRLYAVARWILLVLLFGASTLLHGLELLPVPSPHPFGQVFWGYAAFSVVAGILVITPRAQRIIPWFYLLDLLWLAALAFAGPGSAYGYTSLFMLPLVAAAFRLKRVNVLAMSVVAVILSIALQFKPHTSIEILSFTSQGVMFGVLPWLCNLLSEQWTIDNRHRVAQAEQQSAQALAHAEAYRDRMRALYEAAVSLSTSAHPRTVLETILNEMVRVVPYQTGAILLPTGELNEVHVATGRNLQAAEMNARFTVGGGTLGTIIRGGDGGILNNAHAEAELASLPSISGRRAVLLLPLRSARRTYGLALFASDTVQFDLEQMEMATTLISYGLVVLQNAQLIAEIRTERNNLLAREEEVRKQLNRDLHDGPAQALAAITMTLGFIKRLYEKEPERVVPELDKLAQLAQRANHEVRTLLFELRPLVLETQGLLPTLQQYLERFEPNSNTPEIILEGGESIGPLTKRVQGTLFNIVQESVNNAIKHAQAKHIWIRIQKQGDDVLLCVQDDGKGFDLQSVKASYDQRGSFGLLSLEERARLVGGSAEIISAPGAGTTVRVGVPLEG
ncbi:MAG TPA: GAF domain-containing sensor histidine kinase [Herpetosiphonaceae bacterium]